MYTQISKATFWLLSIIVILFMYSCTQSNAKHGNPPDVFSSEKLKLDRDNESITYKNLRLYPIYANEDLEPVGDFLPLQKAVEDSIVDISEKSINAHEGDQVNTLYIENKSQDTVFMMAGEVVKGGNQDRTLATDVVLEPNSGKHDVQVFCVEQSRWQTKEENVVADKPNEEKKFKQSAPVVKNSIRKMATISKEQNKVWAEVDASIQKAGATNATMAYTAIDNLGEYKNVELEYKRFFTHKLATKKKVVGFIAVSDNKVIGCDVFATHQLFKIALPTILPAYINEAVHDGKAIHITKDSVEQYYIRLFDSKVEQGKYLQSNGKIFEHKNRGLHLNAF